MDRRLFSKLLHSLGILVVFFVVGCGQSGPQLADVSGVVRLDGKPVAGATLTYIPVEPGGSPSYGATDVNGKYTLRFTARQNGALLGEHQVEISTAKLSKSELEELKAAGQEPPEYVKIPKKYQSGGELRSTVKKGSNKIDFDLTSK